MKGPMARFVMSAATEKAASISPASVGESAISSRMKGRRGIIIAMLKLMRKKAAQRTRTTGMPLSPNRAVLKNARCSIARSRRPDKNKSGTKGPADCGPRPAGA
jgi:hypothetical protein